nr:PREDICTED: plastidial pyruvate kinase 2-like [Musa acuminata subsp. malaccensis]
MAQVVATRSIQALSPFAIGLRIRGREEPSPRAQAFDATPEVLPPGKVAEDRDRQLLPWRGRSLVPTPVFFLKKGIQQFGEVPKGLWSKPNVVRQTKIVCTIIGPSTNTREMIWKLAEAGMNVARLNMSHGDHASHQKSSISCLTPRQGPEVRSGDSPQLITLTSRRDFTFEIKGGVGSDTCVSVSYDDFVNDVEVGGMLLVDGK